MQSAGAGGGGDVGNALNSGWAGVADSASDGDRHGNILKFRYEMVSAKREKDGRGRADWERRAGTTCRERSEQARGGANLGVGKGKWVTLPGAAFVVPETTGFSSADWLNRAGWAGENAADLHLRRVAPRGVRGLKQLFPSQRQLGDFKPRLVFRDPRRTRHTPPCRHPSPEGNSRNAVQTGSPLERGVA